MDFFFPIRELTTLAALNDQQFVGDDIDALNPHPCNRPN
jgi:hypothetical protein